jgi:hypothetical protein
MNWFIVLVVVSQVLIITTSALPLILRSWTHAPAFNLLLSTIVKDSLDSETPKTGSTLESSDSSRLSGYRIIRLGGVAQMVLSGNWQLGLPMRMTILVDKSARCQKTGCMGELSMLPLFENHKSVNYLTSVVVRMLSLDISPLCRSPHTILTKTSRSRLSHM